MAIISNKFEISAISISKKFGIAYNFGQAIFGQAIFGNEEIILNSSQYGAIRFGDLHFGQLDSGLVLPKFGVYQQRHCSTGKKTILEKFYIPKYSNSEAIQISRAKFKNAVLAYNELTTKQKLIYYNRAKYKHYTGRNLFIREYMTSH